MRLDVHDLLMRQNEDLRRKAESEVTLWIQKIMDQKKQIATFEAAIQKCRETIAEHQKAIREFALEPLDAKDILGEE